MDLLLIIKTRPYINKQFGLSAVSFHCNARVLKASLVTREKKLVSQRDHNNKREGKLRRRESQTLNPLERIKRTLLSDLVVGHTSLSFAAIRNSKSPQAKNNSHRDGNPNATVSAMSPIQNFEQHSSRLVEPDLRKNISLTLSPLSLLGTWPYCLLNSSFYVATQTRLEMVVEVRESLEITHTADYSSFLKCYFKASSLILLQITKPQFVDNLDHKLRNVVLEILNRIPHSEVLRPYVQDLLKVAMQVLTTDNEENGLICLRIIFDLLRNFRPALEKEVQPFLDFFLKIYQNFGLTVGHFLEEVKTEEGKPVEISAPPSDQSLSLATHFRNGKINPSTRSFKIVAESPLVVMFLLQLYSRLVHNNIPALLPLMFDAISVTGPEKLPSRMKRQFIELKGAQIKVRQLFSPSGTKPLLC